MSFFCRGDEGVGFEAKHSKDDKIYPIALEISSTPTSYPKIDIFLNEVSFVAFKNSVLHQYNKYLEARRG